MLPVILWLAVVALFLAPGRVAAGAVPISPAAPAAPAAARPASAREGEPVAAPPSPATGAPGQPAGPRVRMPVPRPVGPSLLPDSVLVRIDGREDVSRRRFVRAVRLLGGDPDSLTPLDRDRFLELVLEQRVLAAYSTRTQLQWDHADSVRFMAERDNILLRAALSDEFTRIEDRRRSLGQPDLDEDAMGVAARESLMVELKPVYDGELLKTVGSYFAELPESTPDMSPMQQIALTKQSPNIPAADTSKVLAKSRLGDFTVAQLLADWTRLSSIYRPHVRDDEGVRALVQNSLFERLIRQAAEQPALARRPEVASVIADRMEYHGVSNVLQHEVVERIPTDSLTLLAHYQKHVSDFDRPARAVLVLLNLDNQRAADSLARLFAVPGEAESLAFRAQRGGVHYTLEVTAASDSALYAEALRIGAGGVSGAQKGDAGWRLYKVMSVEPRAAQPFVQVRPQVERSWYEFESERRVRELLDDLKRKARVVRNQKALRALVLPRARAHP